VTSNERRVLVMDDSSESREFFIRALQLSGDSESDTGSENTSNGIHDPGHPSEKPFFELDFSGSCTECLSVVTESMQTGKKYSVCIIHADPDDEFDPVEFANGLWVTSPNLQIILCTNAEHRFWPDILRRLKLNSNLMILSKPLMESEVLHAALLLSEKSRSASELKSSEAEEASNESQQVADMRDALESVLVAMRKVRSEWTKIRLLSAQRTIRKLDEDKSHSDERSSPRLAFCRDVLVLVLNPILTKDPFIRVMSRDVSQGGMSFLYFREIVEPRILTFLQVQNRPPIICYGTVTRCVQVEYGMWEYGVKFDDRVPNISRSHAAKVTSVS